MKGLLVVNNFLNSVKFNDIYMLFAASAKRQGIELSVCRSGELLHRIEPLKDLECDFVLFWDKDIILAKMLEKAGHRLFNSAIAVENCDNKALTAICLESAGINTPETYIAPLTFSGIGYNNLDFATDIAKKICYPLVVKELYGSFGMQVYLAEDFESLSDIIRNMGYKGFLMQKYISCSRGRDIRVNVVGNEAVSWMYRHNENDFRSNISNGGSMSRISLSDEWKKAAVAAANALSLDFAGVDILFGENNEPIICEVNSNPHFRSTLSCTGCDMSDIIISYIKRELSK